MGAIGDDEVMQWEKMEALETAGSDASGKVEKIVVTVRLRPLSVKEIAANDSADWECINDTTIMFRNSLNERSMAPTAYTFDRVFGGECSTRQVYEEGAKEVALQVVSGINSTIFAYGQTSSGKTYTMTGIAEYTVADIYNYIQKHEERAFVLKFSAIEIYNEAVRDLLTVDDTPLRVLDDPERGISVEKLTEVLLKDWNHLKELLAVCEGQRQTGETLLNEMSSRSHQILRLTINSSAREFLGKDNPSTLAASVNFVDLAGSERASQALSVGNRLKEGCHINRSLLTLGTVIRKLSKGRNGHIPYRDSKLTRILQPSLGGNARTAIICTMSPARSYIEQSRNTLLFASCAKEVMTSARVNVVMSDRALVKHLQKELARLEDELKCPRANSVTSHYQALLREKDARIKKMEEEIKELVHERELAQSRVEDLLRGVGSSRPSSQWEESCEKSTSRSSVVYHDPDFGSTKFAAYARDNENGNPEKRNALAPRHSIDSLVFSAAIPHQREEVTADGSFEDSEDLYKDVRCIEMERPVGSGDPRSLLEEGTEMDGPVGSRDSNSFPEEGSESFLQPTSDSTRHEDPELNKQLDLRPPRPTITLEQHLQDVRERLKKFVRVYPDESSPCTTSDLSRSRGSMFSRSRSCRESLTKNSSGWFEDTEQNVSTPPRSSHKDLTGRTERFQNRCLALNYGVIGTPSRVGTETFESSTSIAVDSVTSASNGGITSIHDFVAGLKMAQVQYQKQLNGSQETEQNAIEDFGDEATARDIGLDPIVDPQESPSRWPLEFEKQQRDIIDLWHACNVSLAHRTYFFMLFKGDPMDSIYMEVELRRLSFLKRTVASGNFDMKAAKGSNLVSSAKKLQREREMLCRQLQKRYTAEERESLYTKWGIALDSKQRKVQLVRRLWTKTGNLEHVRESATIVAKLIGLLKEGQALREMFGLSFAPEQCYSMPSRWKYGIASFK